MPPTSRGYDPVTGEALFTTASRTWTDAPSAELAIVQAVMRTPLGSAARDRTFGVAETDNAAANAIAVRQQAVLVALKRWIDRGTLRNVVVDVERSTSAQGDAELRTRVTFTGRSSRTPQTVTTP